MPIQQGKETCIMELHVDEEVRQKARAIFSRLGLSEEEAVTLFYKQMASPKDACLSDGRRTERAA